MDKEALVLECSPLIQKIATELIALTSEHWSSFYVEAEVVSKPEDLEDIKLVIKSNEGYDDLVFPSDELSNLVFSVFDMFREFCRIKCLKVDVFMKPDESWGYETDFQLFG